MDWPWGPLHASTSFCGGYKSYHRKWKERSLLGSSMAQWNATKGHRPPHFQMLEKEEEHVTKALEDGHWVTHVNYKHMIAYLLITLCNFTTFWEMLQ
jgi:hypothetical protein